MTTDVTVSRQPAGGLSWPWRRSLRTDMPGTDLPGTDMPGTDGPGADGSRPMPPGGDPPRRRAHGFGLLFWPVLLFALMAGSAGLLFWQLDKVEREADEAEFAVMANDAVVIFEDEVRRRVAILSALARMVEEGVLRDDVDFVRAAAAMSEQHAGFIAINRIDADRVIRVVSPPGRNESARGRKIGSTPEIVALLDEAEATLVPAATRLVPLFQGGTGVATYHPVTIDGRFDGYVNAVIDLPALLDRAARKISSQITLTVAEHDRPTAVEPSTSAFRHRHAMEILNRTWIVGVDMHRLPGRPAWRGAAWGAAVTCVVAALSAVLLFLALRSRQRALASEARYRSYVDIASDWQWETDAELRLCYSSPGADAKRGMASGTLSGRRIDEFEGIGLVPDGWEEHVRRLRARKPFRNFVYGLKTGQGSVNWLRVSGRPAFDEQGRFQGYRGVAQNITAEIQAKLELDAVHQRLADALASIPAGVAIYDADDRKVMSNERNADLVDIGCPGGYPVGIRFEDLQRDLIARGMIVEARDDPEGWLAWRMAKHRDPGAPILIRLANGSAVEIHERRLSDGGSISLRFDVTERERMAQRMASSEERYRLLFQGNPEPMALIDRQTLRVIDVNEAATATFGYTREEMLALRASDLRGPDPVSAAAEMRLWDGTPLRDLPAQLRRKDGSFLDVELGREPLTLDGRDVALIYARDISARVAAEQRLGDFMTASADWLWETGADLRFTWWSDNLEEQLGIDAATLRATSQFDVLAQAPDSADLRAHLAALEARKAFKDFEFPIEPPIGRRWIRVSAVPHFDAGGEFLGYRGVGRDITEIRTAEARLQAAMDATVDGIITVDGEGRIRSVNKATERMFGYAEGGLVGVSLCALLRDPCATGGEGLPRCYLETAGTQTVGGGREVTGIRRDGTAFDLDLVLTALPAGPTEDRYIGTLRDITERKQTEELLRQAQKMEAVGQLTGGVAHDFNNVLAIISLNLELAASRAAGDPLLKEMLDMSLKATGRGAELTRRLLAFARRQPLAPRTVALGEEVRELIRLLERTLPEQIKLEATIADDAPNAVLDSTQLQNALLNLALNARDAMPAGGRLSITLRRETVAAGAIEWPDAVPAGSYGVIGIADTGVGIPPEMFRRVLEPFFTTKPVGQGTGLGLSMVYGFVRQSGGWLALESAPGAGTAVRLFFPLAAAPAAQQPSGQAPAPAARQRRRILLVEDSGALARSVQVILGELGFEVVTVADGEAAVAALEAGGRYDGLLTDIGLPGAIDGYEVCRRARSRQPALKIVTMSGHADRASTAEDGTAERHLQKPFAKAELAAVFNDLFAPA